MGLLGLFLGSDRREERKQRKGWEVKGKVKGGDKGK